MIDDIGDESKNIEVSLSFLYLRGEAEYSQASRCVILQNIQSARTGDSKDYSKEALRLVCMLCSALPICGRYRVHSYLTKARLFSVLLLNVDLLMLSQGLNIVKLFIHHTLMNRERVEQKNLCYNSP